MQSDAAIAAKVEKGKLESSVNRRSRHERRANEDIRSSMEEGLSAIKVSDSVSSEMVFTQAAYNSKVVNANKTTPGHDSTRRRAKPNLQTSSKKSKDVDDDQVVIDNHDSSVPNNTQVSPERISKLSTRSRRSKEQRSPGGSPPTYGFRKK